MSVPLTEKSPFESIAGRNRCVSKPLPLALGITFGVDWASAPRAAPEAASTALTASARRSNRWTISPGSVWPPPAVRARRFPFAPGGYHHAHPPREPEIAGQPSFCAISTGARVAAGRAVVVRALRIARFARARRLSSRAAGDAREAVAGRSNRLGHGGLRPRRRVGRRAR